MSPLSSLIHSSFLQGGADLAPWVALVVAIGIAGVAMIIISTKKRGP